jgi:hypothetical protein
MTNDAMSSDTSMNRMDNSMDNSRMMTDSSRTMMDTSTLNGGGRMADSAR